VIRPHVGRVAIANPRQVRLIAEARIKTDVIHATVLARLYASGFLPEVWVPDQGTWHCGGRSRAAIRSAVNGRG
jgi:transposase